MRRAAAVVLLVVAGCGGDDEPPPRGPAAQNRGTESGDVRLPAPAPVPTPAPPPRPSAPFGSSAPAVSVNPPIRIEEERPVTERTEVRDLESELRAMAGNVGSCVPDGTELTGGATYTFQISATVSVMGIVTRSTVGAAGLPPEAADCVRRRIEGARFRAPVPDAPRTVSTSIETRAMPVPEKQPPGAPSPSPSPT